MIIDPPKSIEQKKLPRSPLSNLVIYTLSPKFDNTLLLYIKTLPKWLTNLNRSLLNTETGEIIDDGIHETNEIKQSNWKKIKKLTEFCNIFDPLYMKRKVSILFYTFTKINFSNIPFPRLLDDIRYRFAEILKNQLLLIYGFLKFQPICMHIITCVLLLIELIIKRKSFQKQWNLKSFGVREHRLDSLKRG